jgi:tetratricopeptide (TPR) repeat protein
MKRSAAAALCLLLFAGCAHAPARRSAGLPPEAPSPKLAVALAEKEPDAASAADLAWILGNDRALARRRLDQGLKANGKRSGLLLRRSLLSAAELDDEAALRDLLRVVALEGAPEAELDAALVLLLDRFSRYAPWRSEIMGVLAHSALLSPAGGVPPLPAALAGLLASRLLTQSGDDVGAKAAIERGGWLTAFSALGPLAPEAHASLAEPTPFELGAPIPPKDPPRFRGHPVPARTLPSERGAVLPAAGDQSGLYVLGTDVSTEEGGRFELGALLPSAGRVRVDGALLVERHPEESAGSAFQRAALELTPGVHRVTVALLASANERVQVYLLRADGRRGFAEEGRIDQGARGHLSGEVQKAAPLDFSRLSVSTATSPWAAWTFGGWLALSGWAGDLEQARALLRPAGRAAPDSAILAALDAQLMIREGFPTSLSQASLRRALELDPHLPKALLLLAHSYEREQKDQALALLQQAEEVAPRSSEPARVRFEIQRARGWLSEAEASLTRALERAPSAELLDEGARFYRQQYRIGEARKLEDQAALLAEPNGLGHKSTAALLSGDIDRAVALLESSAGSSAQPAEPLVRAAELLVGAGALDRALPLLSRALEADPLSARAMRLSFEVHLERGERALAGALIERLRAIGADDLDLELAAARLDPTQGSPVREGTWLGAKLAVDAQALAKTPPDPRWASSKRERLLDRVVDVVRPDGRAVSEQHQILRLLTKEATDQEGEFRLSGDTLPLALRTIKADGRVIDVDRHSGKADLSFSALAPGDVIEQKWLTIAEPATPSGGYLRQFYFQDDTPNRRSELVVAVPHGTPVWFQGYHGAPTPEIHDEAGLTLYYFCARDVPGVVHEPSSAGIDEFLPFVVVSVGLDPAALDLADRYPFEALARSSFDVRAEALRLAAGAKNDREIVHRIFDWVVANVRHGGYGDPAVILATRRGNRTGLLVAMLRAAGLDADLTAARPGTAPRLDPPYPEPHRHTVPLVRVRPRDALGPNLWLRADSASAWLGKATPEFRGGDYIVPTAVGAKPEPFKDDEIERWDFESRAELTVDKSGAAEGTLKIRFPGQYGEGLRQALRPLREEDLGRALQAWLSAVLPGGELVGVRFEGMDQKLEPFEVEVTVKAPHFLAPEGGALITDRFFDAPLALRAMNVLPLESYLQVASRKTPLFVPETGETMAVVLHLPKDGTAVIEGPETFDQDSPFGRFSQRFTFDPASATATLVRVERTPWLRVSPEKFGAFRELIQEVALRTRNRLVLGARR